MNNSISKYAPNRNYAPIIVVRFLTRLYGIIYKYINKYIYKYIEKLPSASSGVLATLAPIISVLRIGSVGQPGTNYLVLVA